MIPDRPDRDRFTDFLQTFPDWDLMVWLLWLDYMHKNLLVTMK